MGDLSRDLFPKRGCNNPEVIDFIGRFALSTSPAIVAGRAYSVSYAATGLFTVTTLFQWKDLASFNMDVMSATLTDRVQLVSFSASLRQIVFQFQSAGAADAGTVAKQISFSLKLAQKALALK
jgi:hypothetical protein